MHDGSNATTANIDKGEVQKIDHLLKVYLVTGFSYFAFLLMLPSSVLFSLFLFPFGRLPQFDSTPWIRPPKFFWRAFLESPETFRDDFGYDKSHSILKIKTFSSMELWYKLDVSHRKDMLKQQLCRMSGSYFSKWLIGSENFSGLSRNAHQRRVSGCITEFRRSSSFCVCGRNA